MLLQTGYAGTGGGMTQMLALQGCYTGSHTGCAG